MKVPPTVIFRLHSLSNILSTSPKNWTGNMGGLMCVVRPEATTGSLEHPMNTQVCKDKPAPRTPFLTNTKVFKKTWIDHSFHEFFDEDFTVDHIKNRATSHRTCHGKKMKQVRKKHENAWQLSRRWMLYMTNEQGRTFQLLDKNILSFLSNWGWSFSSRKQNVEHDKSPRADKFISWDWRWELTWPSSARLKNQLGSIKT